MPTSQLEITAIPALTDNYIWLLRTGGNKCAIVDPGEAGPVIQTLQRLGLELSYILLTHHHYDHVDGVPELLERYDADVIGPVDERIPFVTTTCHEDKTVSLAGLGLKFKVLEIPAHTRSHIAFYGHGVLFCGDTLFSVGCGRLFEGTAMQMQQAMDKLRQLPEATKVYCAHEYTQANCAFARAVEPGNQALQDRTTEVDSLRAAGQMTVPSTLGEELAVNPFLRTRIDTVVETARQRDATATPGAGTMAVIRAWKDRF